MKYANELMTRNPKMIESSESLHTVVELFLKQGISSSPVISPAGELLGVLTEFSLVKAYMLYKLKFPSNDKIGHHVEMLDQPAFVSTTATLGEVMRELVKSPTRRLLVQDVKNKIVGIISPKDILRVMEGDLTHNVNIRKKLEEAEQKVKELDHKIQDLSKHLNIYQQVFNETPYMVHAVDRVGNIVLANRRVHDVLGYEDQELVGKTIFELYSANMHAEAKRGLERVIEKGFHNIVYTTMKTKDGSSVRVDICSAAIFNNKGEFVSTVSISRPLDSENLLRALNGMIENNSENLYAQIQTMIKKGQSD